MMGEKKILIKEYYFFILFAKEEGENNSYIAKKFI